MKKESVEKCSFCGRPLSIDTTLIKGNDAYICPLCIKKGYTIISDKKDKEYKKFSSPKEIYSLLDKTVIGQENVKKTLSVSVYNHLLKVEGNIKENCIDKSNILLIGPTGSGKTFIIKELAKMLNLPLAITDATSLTEAGYVGDDVENILLRLYEEANQDITLAEKGIIYIDEIDKIAKKGQNLSITRDVSGEGVQQSLLKIIEGSVCFFPSNHGRKIPFYDNIKMNTKNILFICGGAFSGIEEIVKKRDGGIFSYDKILEEDLEKYGMIPELLGRLPVKLYLDKLTVFDMIKILKNPNNTFIEQYKKIFKMNNIELVIVDEAIEYSARHADKLNLGARGMKSILDKIIMDIEFELDYMHLPKEVCVDKKKVEYYLKKTNMVFNKEIKSECIS